MLREFVCACARTYACIPLFANSFACVRACVRACVSGWVQLSIVLFLPLSLALCCEDDHLKTRRDSSELCGCVFACMHARVCSADVFACLRASVCCLDGCILYLSRTLMRKLSLEGACTLFSQTALPLAASKHAKNHSAETRVREKCYVFAYLPACERVCLACAHSLLPSRSIL